MLLPALMTSPSVGASIVMLGAVPTVYVVVAVHVAPPHLYFRDTWV